MPDRHKSPSVRSAHLENLEEIIHKIIDAATAPKKRKITRTDQYLIAKYQLLNYLHQQGTTDPDLEKHIDVYGRDLAVEAKYCNPETHTVTAALIYSHASTVPQVKQAYFDQKSRIPKTLLHRDAIGYRQEYHYLIYTDSTAVKETKLSLLGLNPLGPTPLKPKKL